MLLARVNGFDFAILNTPHQALVHVVIVLISIEAWIC
jgi:hypothetical protein